MAKHEKQKSRPNEQRHLSTRWEGDTQHSPGKAGTGVELRDIKETSKESRISEMKRES